MPSTFKKSVARLQAKPKFCNRGEIARSGQPRQALIDSRYKIRIVIALGVQYICFPVQWEETEALSLVASKTGGDFPLMSAEERLSQRLSCEVKAANEAKFCSNEFRPDTGTKLETVTTTYEPRNVLGSFRLVQSGF
ncbi:hypothetical protein BY996DRAFT_6416997 [Phakopsora pachyrhizi]|nr:hypothetical protein BY996DRAFT_6416997 [Phakopsora pachyrhizi]